MAQQDKTDWYWNGVLAGGAVNNLYYDLINVDVVHVPYATTHRNTSFFLKTRPGYVAAESWINWYWTSWWDVTDIKIIWKNDDCTKQNGTVYVMGKKWKNKAIFVWKIENWCVYYETDWNNDPMAFFNCTDWCSGECPDMTTEWYCWDRKLFTTNYVKWPRKKWTELAVPTGSTTVSDIWILTWIQMNKYVNWTSVWLFTDEYVESWDYAFTSTMFKPWNFILVYESWTAEEDWAAWQVRLIIWKDDSDWIDRVMVSEPWLWLKVAWTTDWDPDPETWKHVSYAVFEDWGEVIWFTANNKIYLMPNDEDCDVISPYNQYAWENTSNIIWVADASDKIFVLTENWYIHYCSEWSIWWYNKFFIQDDMFAWVDKTSITSFRDAVITFGRRHIGVWIPDTQWEFWTMYNQSTSVGIWSKYAFWEYDWDLVFVSNDKRLMALWPASATGRYMFQFQDVGWQILNSKLSTMLDTDEVFIWTDGNNLRVFVQTKAIPYVDTHYHTIEEADRNLEWDNTMTHIYKYDTLFSVWTEDHVPFLLSWATEWVTFGEDWLYVRRYSKNKYPNNPGCDVQWTDSHTKWPYESRINAYLIENEADWSGASNSWLANRPKLYNTAKLNRLLTTLWPWIYSNNTKIKITTYSKWIWYTYEFPISGDWNDWVWLITDYYLWESLTPEQEEKIECMLSTLQDWQIQYQAKCTDKKLHYHTEVQKTPWCDTYREFLIQDHWVCINDKLYELAPTMPLTTTLWENQPYATQIKLELIWGVGDIICFGWRIWEMFVAPIFTTGPDWEYQLQPNTDCD